MQTILLIEDNPAIRENLTEYLEMEGYSILAAPNGKKGVELATQHLPDLIICDMLMPEMNGSEVLNTLINTERTKAIPFIFSTSVFEKNDITEALETGADDFITKPFEPEALLKMVKNRIANGSKRKK